MSHEKLKGSVMVIGGGIAGIEASISLSSTGYGVHLVERSASLGGMVPDLHRTYPLCACCKIDPRIAACIQDPNINIMLETKALNISGEKENFSITVQTTGNEKLIEAGAVILAAGVEPFDPTEYKTYSYGIFPNVITSVEYEQIQKPLGPSEGIIKRPSDGKVPKKIAWLQCVGSRDINQCDSPYCSSVCCMYALKEAFNTKELNGDIETTIFYMDMRAHGKGFEDYLNKAVESGVNLIRNRVHTVDQVKGGNDLIIAYVGDNGKSQEEVFDMVVLSVGLRPVGDAIELAEKAGITLNSDHFVKSEPFRQVSTNIPGIFVCGGTGGPYDIGQSITQATAAVSEIASFLKPEPFSTPKKYPEPIDIKGKEPQSLLAYHACPGTESDLWSVIEKRSKKIPGITTAVKVEGDILNFLAEKIKETGVNMLLFASCTPFIYKNLIEEALKLSGLNPYLYEMVDLRVIDPGTASSQVNDRIRMGAVKVSLISPAPLKQVKVEKRALIVGGGVAGLESALAIAGEGYPATIIEKGRELGGHGRHVRSTWHGDEVQKYLMGLISSVEKNEKITVMTETTVRENRGSAGRFITTLDDKGSYKEIIHGVVILAPGGDPVKPKQYMYGEHSKVYLWSELSENLIKDPSSIENAESAVFIQCVGSREPECRHCSNFCCSFTVRTAIDLKSKNPDMDIYILFREMRTFGERENLYHEARNRGIIFIRYDLDNRPVVENHDDQDMLSVTLNDPILEMPINIQADFISLQTAIKGSYNQELADIFKISLDDEGFFAESPEKLRPSDSTREGVYLAGMAMYPKDTVESITQAKAASARALEILIKDAVQVGGLVAEVITEKCAVCCTCVRTCPFNVPFIDREKGAASIDPDLCQGCGICVAECPGKAIVMSACSDQMLTEAPSTLLRIS